MPELVPYERSRTLDSELAGHWLPPWRRAELELERSGIRLAAAALGWLGKEDAFTVRQGMGGMKPGSEYGQIIGWQRMIVVGSQDGGKHMAIALKRDGPRSFDDLASGLAHGISDVDDVTIRWVDEARQTGGNVRWARLGSRAEWNPMEAYHVDLSEAGSRKDALEKFLNEGGAFRHGVYDLYLGCKHDGDANDMTTGEITALASDIETATFDPELTRRALQFLLSEAPELEEEGPRYEECLDVGALGALGVRSIGQ